VELDEYHGWVVKSSYINFLFLHHEKINVCVEKVIKSKLKYRHLYMNTNYLKIKLVHVQFNYVLTNFIYY